MVDSQPYPDVFEFLNYRAYLRALAVSSEEYSKMSDVPHVFSYQNLAKWAEYKQKSYIFKVGAEAAHLGPERAKKLAKRIFSRLSGMYGDRAGYAEEYFVDLVNYARLDVAKVQALHNKIFKCREQYGLSVRIAEQNMALKYVHDWEVLPIRQLILCQGFQWDPEWIAKRFWMQISPERIKKVLQLLVDNDDAERIGNSGRLKRPKLFMGYESIDVEGADRALRISLLAFYRRAFQVIMKALETLERNRRFANVKFVSVPRRRIPEVREKIIALVNETDDILDDDNEPTNAVLALFAGFVELTEEPMERAAA
jgi:uncharacterized protein (TIGR02147 family)